MERADDDESRAILCEKTSIHNKHTKQICTKTQHYNKHTELEDKNTKTTHHTKKHRTNY